MPKPNPPLPYHDPAKLLKIYDWMVAYKNANGYPPSNREVADAFPTKEGKPRSTSVVRFYYSHMAELGFIEYIPHISRGVRFLGIPKSFRNHAENQQEKDKQ